MNNTGRQTHRVYVSKHDGKELYGKDAWGGRGGCQHVEGQGKAHIQHQQQEQEVQSVLHVSV